MTFDTTRWTIGFCFVSAVMSGCGNSAINETSDTSAGGAYVLPTSGGAGAEGPGFNAFASGGGASTCSGIGQYCASDLECCSSRCDFGQCLGNTGLCSGDGADCAASAECCSGRCEPNLAGTKTCVASSGTCMPGGERCSADGDCCSGVCNDDGICPVFAQCQTAGEPCTGHHQCCTGACADPGTGTPVCQYVGGCRPIGEVCNSDGDCCSALCQLDSGSGVSRCAKPTGCMWPGEVCWTGQAANCCPQGHDGGKSLCMPSVIGVNRCFTAGTPNACLEYGSPCAFGDECCGGTCVPDLAGVLKCDSECIPLGGQRCTSDSDCCAGRCAQGSCVASTQECTPLGKACANDAACCSGSCSNGYCGVTAVVL